MVSQNRPVLSVIIPSFNESRTIREIVRRVSEFPLEKEILIVDDGSTDGSKEILEQVAITPQPNGNSHMRLFTHSRRMGKGAAIQTALQDASGDITIIQDADLEYDPRDYAEILKPILEGRADVVFGSRFLGGPRRVLFFRHALGNKVLTFFSNLCTDLYLTDMGTCYKACKTELLRSLPLRSKGFGIEPELTAKFAKMRCRIYEVPISYYGRSYAEGKKFKARHALMWFWIIFKYWLIDDLFKEADLKSNLRIMEGAGRYNQWLFSRCKKFLGQRVLEVGSGEGNITKFLLDRTLALATDFSDYYIDQLQKQFGGFPNFKVERLDLLSVKDLDRARSHEIDTVLAMNVIEHIEDDTKAIQNIHSLLPPNGRFVILVPAHASLYSPVDKLVGHFRRYSKSQVDGLLQQAGFRVTHIRYVNILGAMGWFMNGRILHRQFIPSHQLRLFDLFVPFLGLEEKVKLPFGLSVLAVGEKVTP